MGSPSPARRRLLVVLAGLALAAGLAGCGGGEDSSAEVMDQETTAPAKTTVPPAAEASTTTTEGKTGTTTTVPPEEGSEPETTVDPPVALRVPVDDALVARLPDLSGSTRDVSDDDSFDPRQCDGSAVPVIPGGQAEAAYRGPEGSMVIGAVQLATEEEAAMYLAGFTASLAACDSGDGRGRPPEAVRNLGQAAIAAEVSTGGEVTRILAARQGSTVWYLSQQVEEGIDGLSLPVVSAFQQAVGG